MAASSSILNTLRNSAGRTSGKSGADGLRRPANAADARGIADQIKSGCLRRADLQRSKSIRQWLRGGQFHGAFHEELEAKVPDSILNLAARNSGGSPVSPAMPADWNRGRRLPTEAPDNTARLAIGNNRAATTHATGGAPIARCSGLMIRKNWCRGAKALATRFSNRSNWFLAAVTDSPVSF